MKPESDRDGRGDNGGWDGRKGKWWAHHALLPRQVWPPARHPPDFYHEPSGCNSVTSAGLGRGEC